MECEGEYSHIASSNPSQSKKETVDGVCATLNIEFGDLSGVLLERAHFAIKYMACNPALMHPLYDDFDWKAHGCNDYPSTVKYPICLNRVQKGFHDGEYKSFEEVVYDLALMYTNSILYNPKGDPLHEVSVLYLQNLHILAMEMADSCNPAFSLSQAEEISLHAPRFLLALTCRDRQGIFHNPVQDDIAPGYSTFILHPISLRTIWKRLDIDVYHHWHDLTLDLRTMWQNAEDFNLQDEDLRVYIRDMKNFSEEVYGVLYKDLSSMTVIQGGVTPEMSEAWVDEFKKVDHLTQSDVMNLIDSKAAFVARDDDVSMETISFSIPYSLYFQTKVMLQKAIKYEKTCKRQRKSF